MAASRRFFWNGDVSSPDEEGVAGIWLVFSLLVGSSLQNESPVAARTQRPGKKASKSSPLSALLWETAPLVLRSASLANKSAGARAVVSAHDLYPTCGAAGGKGRRWASRGAISRTHSALCCRVALVKFLPLSELSFFIYERVSGRGLRKTHLIFKP